MKKSRVRSRSRRRARSRARARALSSPPEVLSVAESEELPVAKKDDQKKGGRSVVVKDSSKEVMLSSKDELFVLGEIQLEEGEIGVEGGRESIDMSSIGRKESRNQDDEKGFWITKHSKHYRRALREMESWRALGSIGNPPKSAKILIRGSSSVALGWRFDNNYSVASGGRIWLMWSQNLSVVVYLKTEQLILCGVLEPATGMSCTVSFVYAQNTEEERRVLWRNLVMIARNSLLAASPFVVLDSIRSLDCGDANTRFFHKAVLAHQVQNCISYLLDGGGNRVFGLDQIKEMMVVYFKNLLGSEDTTIQATSVQHLRTLISYRCPQNILEQLVEIPSEEDIKATLLALPKNKALGPDGFSAEFFWEAWEVVGWDAVEAVKEFFTGGRMLRQFNTTAISLIPKVTGADQLSFFRPISLCSTIYKVMARLLKKKLRVCVSDIVQRNQVGFVQDRLLSENVLLASELLSNSINHSLAFNASLTSVVGLSVIIKSRAYCRRQIGEYGTLIIIFSIMYMEFLILLNHGSLKIFNHHTIFKWSYKTETYSQEQGFPTTRTLTLGLRRASRFFTNQKSSLHILEHFIRICSYINFSQPREQETLDFHCNTIERMVWSGPNAVSDLL
ncbi:hypothetical protein Bca101_092417 [Brassica carinata]